MIDVKYFEKLPDFMSEQELKMEISRLLKTDCSNGALSQLEALYELSIRKENSDLKLDDFSVCITKRTPIINWLFIELVYVLGKYMRRVYLFRRRYDSETSQFD